MRASTFGFSTEAGVWGEYGERGDRGEVAAPGKTYGVGVFFSWVGQDGLEKLREELVGLLRLEFVENCVLITKGRGSVISISRLLDNFPSWRCFLLTRATPMMTRKTHKTYAPTMPPISIGRCFLSLEAPADSGGPSSGDGAGFQSMPSGFFLGISVRMLAELIGMRPSVRRMKCALMNVSAKARIVVHLQWQERSIS